MTDTVRAPFFHTRDLAQHVKLVKRHAAALRVHKKTPILSRVQPLLVLGRLLVGTTTGDDAAKLYAVYSAKPTSVVVWFRTLKAAKAYASERALSNPLPGQGLRVCWQQRGRQRTYPLWVAGTLLQMDVLGEVHNWRDRRESIVAGDDKRTYTLWSDELEVMPTGSACAGLQLLRARNDASQAEHAATTVLVDLREQFPQFPQHIEEDMITQLAKEQLVLAPPAKAQRKKPPRSKKRRTRLVPKSGG